MKEILTSITLIIGTLSAIFTSDKVAANDLDNSAQRREKLNLLQTNKQLGNPLESVDSFKDASKQKEYEDCIKAMESIRFPSNAAMEEYKENCKNKKK